MTDPVVKELLKREPWIKEVDWAVRPVVILLWINGVHTFASGRGGSGDSEYPWVRFVAETPVETTKVHQLLIDHGFRYFDVTWLLTICHVYGTRAFGEVAFRDMMATVPYGWRESA
jgi:hypothetical protein